MLRALWTAGQGMVAQQLNVDVISNNLANVNTTGFKKDRIEFKDMLYETFSRADLNADGEGRPINLQVGHGVSAVASVKNYRTGNLQKTERSLDFALEGEGFFKVLLPSGDQVYTRDGSFKVSVTPQGSTITTSDGYTVLDENDEPILLEPGLDVNDLVVSDSGALSYLGLTYELRMGQINQSILAKLQNPEEDPLNLYALLPVETQEQIDAGTYVIDQDFMNTINTSVIKSETFEENLNPDTPIENNRLNTLLEAKTAGTITPKENQEMNFLLLSEFYGDHVQKNPDEPQMISLNKSFSISAFQNRYGLESLGGNFYRETDASGEAIPNAQGVRPTRVTQYFVESSNVQIVEEMVDLIVAQRAYEINSKSIQTADDMLNTANNLKR